MEDGAAYLGLHEEGHTEVDSVATHYVVDIKNGLSSGLGQIEDTTDVILLEDFSQSSLVLSGELDDLDVDVVLGS